MTVVPESLATGELILRGRIRPASNATFLGEIDGVAVVYKPEAGERPLWDFPDGTLAGREVAAYLVSEASGWGVVPRTIHRDGPHGPGMVQVWQEPDPELAAVDVVPEGEVPPGYLHVFDAVDLTDRPVALVHEDTPELRVMAAFDIVVNNADRKGGHVLAMTSGRRYGVDHGLTFHVERKLRTVLWGWAGERIGEPEVAGLERILDRLGDGLATELADWVRPQEVQALRRRVERLLRDGRMPAPTGDWPAIPWPPF